MFFILINFYIHIMKRNRLQMVTPASRNAQRVGVSECLRWAQASRFHSTRAGTGQGWAVEDEGKETEL